MLKAMKYKKVDAFGEEIVEGLPEDVVRNGKELWAGIIIWEGMVFLPDDGQASAQEEFSHGKKDL